MKYPLCLLALCLAAWPCVADTTQPLKPVPGGSRSLATPASPTHFTFALSGDNRSTGRNVPQPPTCDQIFAEIRLLQPDFTLWTGDAIYGSDDTVGEADAEYDTFLASAATSATPLFNAPGNHEIFDRPELATLYAKRMGKLYGSFDYGNSHFVAVDTEEAGVKGGISKKQMDWLRHDLETNKSAAHIFAFMHHPLYPKDPKEGFPDLSVRDALHKLFVQNKVKNVFSGHEHIFYKSEHDGVTYWVSGGGGAPNGEAPEDGGFQHYVLFTVDGDSVTSTVLEPWRLFAKVGPPTADGAQTALVTNYHAVDLPVYIEFPGDTLSPSVTAASVYKGKAVPLEAAIVPSHTKGVVTVRVVVPKGRGATVTLRSKP
jgi:hypothetical protein